MHAKDSLNKVEKNKSLPFVNFCLSLPYRVKMRVHLIKKQSIENYAASHARSKTSFTNWLSLQKSADWEIPGDIKKTFGSADLLQNGTNRVVFNIGGNDFRMIGKYFFGYKKVHLYICWIGTHGEYDKLCDNNEQYTVNSY